MDASSSSLTLNSQQKLSTTNPTTTMTPQEALQILDQATETQTHPRLSKRDHVNVVVALETLAGCVQQAARVPELEEALAQAKAALLGSGDAPVPTEESVGSV
jgi:hypothetical protein